MRGAGGLGMSSVNVPGGRPFFLRVEALRGIGAAMVAGYHISGWGAPAGRLLPHDPWIGAGALQNTVGRVELYLFTGHAALMVFFAISGFVLRVSLQYGPQDFGRAAVRFHVARFFRIYPIVVFGMFVAAIAHNWQLPQADTPLSLSTLVANFLLLDVSLNTTLWAIQLEVVMAPLIVMLYFLECRQGPRVLAVIAVVATFLAFSNWALWRPLSEYFFAFVLGMLIPTLGKNWVLGLSRMTVNRLLLSAVVCLFLPWPLLGFYSKFSAVIEGYAAALLVCIIAYRLEITNVRCLDWRPIRMLGLSSGSFYVLHMSVLPWIVPIVARMIPNQLSIQIPVLAGPLVIFGSLVLFAPIALLSYHGIEAPGISLGRIIIARRTVVPAENDC